VLETDTFFTFNSSSFISNLITPVVCQIFQRSRDLRPAPFRDISSTPARLSKDDAIYHDFSDHISDIVVRAHRRAYIIHRCFVSGNVYFYLLIRTFLTYMYVRPLVEYNSVVWSPYHKGDIWAIDVSVQSDQQSA